MKIGGLQKTSFIDYPEYISAVVWTVGCNFRCPFCYNKDLVFGRSQLLPEEEIISFLQKRQGMIEGVVISGGEPLLQDDLSGFLQKIRKLGFLIKLDTNGSLPDRLKVLLDDGLVDYVALDVKAPKKKYPSVCGCEVDVSNIQTSMDLIRKQAPEYEFRTTVVPSLLNKEDIIEIAHWIAGAQQWYLQQFKVFPPLVSSELEKINAYDRQFFDELIVAVQPFIEKVVVRGL
ncbi:MAG: anaerobic ribonucleoside-triphosphate reductase activating protein [Candidatus Thermoplasmatota archaeon]